ncbi:uncharacterized protein LOC134294213 [Anolis carolinensis]|uniref:uncharacterized protein LOC134294213 n=1 Tax=Anolis carolinensis TaxID=28377 RepID=UPI002F2B7065
MDRLELTLRHNHLTSLWGRGTRFLEDLGPRAPRAPSCFQPPRPKQAKALPLSEEETPFLQTQEREALELHVKSKRLQHEWRLPGLLERSLSGFRPAPRLQTGPSKLGISIDVLRQDPCFLPQSTFQRLDFHLQRMKLQRQWGLPKRVLGSLKGLCPGIMVGPPDVHQMEDGVALSQGPGHHVNPGLSIPGRTEGKLLPMLAPNIMNRMEVHWARKSMEVNLELVPDMVRRSWLQMARLSRQPLPRNIPPGLMPQKVRTSSFPFLHAGKMDKIEMSVKCHHMAFLWGLGTLHLEALSGMTEPKPTPEHPGPRGSCIAFSESETPFLLEEERQALETHVSMKKIHHAWALPSLVQKSIMAFVPEPPQAPFPQKTTIEINIIPGELSFLSQEVSSGLEFHIHKRTIKQQWGLPRRVLQSLHLMAPRDGSHHQEPSDGQSWRSSLRWPVHGETPIRSWPMGARGAEQNILRRGAESILDTEILRKVAKKGTEMFFEASPIATEASCEDGGPQTGQAFLKVIPAGHGTRQPQSTSLTMVSHKEMGRMELAVQSHHLAPLWGLSKTYKEGLPGMGRAPSNLPHKYRQVDIEYMGIQTPFILKEVREALEFHVTKKRIHHTWALPGLVQKSIMAFVPGPPQVPFHQKTTIEINIIPGELSFLSQEVSSGLEFHIHKRTIKQQWGLPRRVLQSLRLMAPRDGSHHQEPSDGQSWRSSLRWPVHGKPPIAHLPMDARGIAQGINKRKGAESFLDTKILRKVARKDTEMFFEAPSTANEASCEDGGHQTGHAFLKVIPAGHGTRKPQSTSPTMVSHKEMGRMELAVQSHPLAPLWGLSKTYMHAGMGRAPSNLLHKYRQVDIEFLEIQTPFILKEVREALELHVTKKRIHHAWALPSLVQKSVMAFMQEPPQVPFHQKTTIDIEIIPGELSFLSQKVSSVLEFHIHKRTIKQQWGLPRRVLQSLCLMAPRDGSHHQEPSDGQSWRSSLRWPVHGETPIGSWPMGARGTEQDNLKRRGAESILDTKILRRVAKKDTEMVFEAPPAATEASFEDGGPLARQSLPKLIPPGHGSRQPRSTALTLASHKEMGRMELAVQRCHLASLWGLGKTYIEGLAGMGPGLSTRLPRYTQVDVEFLEMETPFLPKDRREALEFHVTWKRIHHTWSLPGLVQRSLEGFMGNTPSWLEPKKQEIKVHILVQEPLFLPEITRISLEQHLQRRKVKHVWSLPRQVLRSLKHHLPPSHPARVPPYSGKDFAEEDLDGEKEQMHRRCIVMTPFQEVGIQFLQDEDKKKLEYHIQWKKLHHQWGLPTTIQRSLQAFLAPSLLVPTSKDHPIGTVKEVEIQSNRPSFFSDLVQKDLEASLKKMAIHRAQDSLHAVSPATPAIGVQWPHQEEAHTSERSSVSGESSPWIIEEPREQSQRKLYGRHSEAKVSTCGKAMDLQAFQDGSRELLEFHIMHKKICRWWGLPLVVQNSLATLEDFKTSQEETLETTEKETTSSGGSHEVSRVWPEQRSQLWDNTDATDLQSPSTTEGRSSRESDYTSEESVMERVLAFTPELLSPPAAKEETAPEIYISSWTMEYESQGERWSSHSFHL